MLASMQSLRTLTGQVDVQIAQMVMVWQQQKGSVFECSINIVYLSLSRQICCQIRAAVANLLALKKPQKAKIKVALSNLFSRGENYGSGHNCDFNVLRALMVTGRQVCVCLPCNLFMPVHNRWSSSSFIGSSRSLSKLSNCMPARYTFMVLHDTWLGTSVTGSGWLVFCLFCPDKRYGGGGPYMTGKCVGK